MKPIASTRSTGNSFARHLLLLGESRRIFVQLTYTCAIHFRSSHGRPSPESPHR